MRTVGTALPRSDALVPAGAAFLAVPEAQTTRTYTFVLVPGFTLLAFASAVEPLRIANQLSQKPLYCWQVVSISGEQVKSSSGIAVAVEGKLASLDRDATLLVCAGNPITAAAAPPVVAAVARHYRFGGNVGGICTGSVALAKAGLLHNRRFTLHWENQPAFREIFPTDTPSQNRYERDERLISCGGGAASTDMMLAIIAADHGADFAAMVSEMCLRTVMPGVDAEQRSSLSTLMSSRNPVLIATVNLMNRHLDAPLAMDELAEAAGYSRRHLERLFQNAVAMTPGEFYRGLRLDRGRNLLSTTDLTLMEISLACGFDSVSHFSKSFRRRFGVPPTKLKQGIGVPRGGKRG